LDKDAFYFPHFSNARNDRKIRRVRKELGLEGYGIYFALLEVLRDQKDFKYPLEDLDLLADEFQSSEQKVRTVVCNYKLFETDEENFFSLNFNEYLKPYLESKQRNKIKGIKGNLIKYKKLSKEEVDSMTDAQLIDYSNNSRSDILKDSQKDGTMIAKKGKERKRNKVNKVKETPEWKKSFDNYKIYLKEGFNKVCGDTDIMKEYSDMMKEIYPDVDVGATIKHGYHSYWITEDGYEKNKKKKTNEINFKSLIRNILKSDFNHKEKNTNHNPVQRRM
jgi:hypothetical protein